MPAGCRRRLSFRDNTRGLALQTAVIAVTLLIVAGSVAWTLMRQGGSIVGATEAPGIGYLTEAPCVTTRLGGIPGAVRQGSLGSAQEFVHDEDADSDLNPKHCVWSGGRLWPPSPDDALNVDDKACHAFADGRVLDFEEADPSAHPSDGQKICVATLTP
ncbi:MAG: hypothetical protein F4W98_03770 [Acidimicrobiales bacterium]|nr:hypothetical protein [Acidimicrobiales bacterium]